MTPNVRWIAAAALLLATGCLMGPRPDGLDARMYRAPRSGPGSGDRMDVPPADAPPPEAPANGPISTGADLGHIDVAAAPPRLVTQVINSFSFHVQENRLAMSAPENSDRFDVSLDSRGCLRGSAGDAPLVEFCPARALPGDAPGGFRWRSTTRLTTFRVQLGADGSTLVVEAGRARGIFALGKGAPVEQIRQHPEMLGLAFAYGLVPAAKGQGDGDSVDYRFTVAAR